MAQYFREFRDLTSNHETSILLTSFIPILCLVHTHIMVYVLQFYFSYCCCQHGTYLCLPHKSWPRNVKGIVPCLITSLVQLLYMGNEVMWLSVMVWLTNVYIHPTQLVLTLLFSWQRWKNSIQENTSVSTYITLLSGFVHLWSQFPLYPSSNH